MRTVLIVIGTLSLCVCLWLGGLVAYSASRPKATPQIARFAGSGPASVTTKNWQLGVTGVDTTKTLVWSSVGNKQDAVGQWLLISVSLLNTGKENFGVNTWDFEVTDGEGNTYKHSTEYAAIAYPPTKGAKSASSQQVPPGVAVSSILVFDINPAATGLQLVFKQDSKPRVDLGR